ncbi:hypothetical protein GCM10010124_27380 [Pilimelia terevasa]|uniref:Uncharacterized protein n=1 Tax=Pilimelia terevasa TaxID=53372 RepID=A0A8J3BMI1_9ACTN|nr:DUF6114 domain-containing protein [Pilimelia terevasa]GGK33176.1 hypothetical protein GCM10010124_27380 [Pilimelia terevasa]
MSTAEPGWSARRPVAGGLLLLFAGCWTLATAQVRVTGLALAEGPAGLAAWLVPAALLLSGIGVWAAPRHRLAWAAVGGLAALGALVGLNLGGLVVGTLAGILGVAFTAGWVPRVPPDPAAPAASAARHRRAAAREVPRGRRAAAPEGSRRRSPGQRLGPAAAVLLAVVPAGLLAPAAGRPALALPCPPGVTPAAGAAHAVDAARRSAAARPRVPAVPAAGARDPDDGCTAADIRRPGPVVPLEAPAGGPTVAGQQALLTGGAVDMAGLSYDGVVELPTRAGRVRALRFTMDSSTATDVELRLRGPRGATVVSGASLTFQGNVTLYATRLAGAVAGAPVEYTPAAPPPQLTGMSLTSPSLDVVAVRSDRLTMPALALTHED